MNNYKKLGLYQISYKMTLWKTPDFVRWMYNGDRNPEDVINVTTLEFEMYSVDLPSDIKHFVNLECLLLNEYNGGELPLELRNLTSLKKIDLSGSYLEKFPKVICSLTNLEELILTNTYIKTIPKDITKLKNLKRLYVNCNELRCIPDIIGELTELEYLNLYDSNISKLPKGIGKLVNLKHLELGNNRISKFPIEMKNLVNLKFLSISENLFTEFPSSVFEMRNLTYLSISYNEISSLPSEIGRLIFLNQFNVDYNPILHIPPNINRLIYNLKNKQRTIYEDKQNVHNSSIQISFRQSVERLLNHSGFTNEELTSVILENSVLHEQTKKQLIEYNNSDEVYVALNITFGELACIVFKKIMENPFQNNILQILNNEMNDAMCMCFTGKITRLVNCLNGYDDNVKLNIHENEQIRTIILNIKKNLEEKGEYTEDIHRMLSKSELENRGISENIVEEWINYI